MPRAAARHGRMLMRLIHQVTARNAERATMDLSIRERLVVQRLGIEGDLPIAAVGQRLGVSPSTMTGIVDRLEQRDLLRRRPDAGDRRAIRLTLTRKGRNAFEREIVFYCSLVDETLAPLGGESAGLILQALANLETGNAVEDAA